MRAGGLGGAASGASDMVDDKDAAMQCGAAVSDLKVGGGEPSPLVVCRCVCVCNRSGGSVRVQFRRGWS